MKSRTPLLLVALLAVLGLALAGCGGGDEEEAGGNGGQRDRVSVRRKWVR